MNHKFFMIWFAFCGLMSLSMLGFVVWIIIKLMQHFAVI